MGLLMPLPIPQKVWEDISMDFVTNMPKVKGKIVILVDVDTLSQSIAIGVAELFIEMVVKLHGITN